ncbi:MAG: thioredoxin domain-containing protein [Acidobacteria bacterium]|nr:thioredoxin domain-containing protein [Acidobacteriota bacterium]MYD72569.1 thioredoxin domain-containing protein [Acidobacteriota bacterium]MYJ05446.1 thioredoxin domain-containing protein [Acidobacteriota bacterium]
MTGRARTGLLLFAFAGLGASLASTWVHLQILLDPFYVSVCDVNATVSCSQVYESRYGSFLGVPVALGGVIWFTGTLLLAWAGGRAPAESAENVAGYLLTWSTAGLAVAMYLAYASFFLLGMVCLFCVAVYVSVIGVFVLAGSAPATPALKLIGVAAGDLRLLARSPMGRAVAVAFVAGSVGSTLWFNSLSQADAMAALAELPVEDAGAGAPAADPAPPTLSEEDQQSEFERYWSAEPRVEMDLPPASAAAAEGADVVVLKFNDYQCPACANAHRLYGPVFAKYASSDPGRVVQVVLDFPLDPSCNDEAPFGQHDGACAAAVAVRIAAARGEDLRSEMEDWLYNNQPGLTRAAVTEAVADIAGIDQAAYDAAYDETVDAVRADIAVGVALPVEATPTYVVNGVVIGGMLAPRFFDAAIAYELERAAADE